jgi:hypothetical protein
MLKQQNKRFIHDRSPKYQIFLLESYRQLNQTKELVQVVSENQIKSHKESLIYKILRKMKWLIRYYSHGTIQNISNN